MGKGIKKIFTVLVIVALTGILSCSDSVPFYEPLDTALIGTWNIENSGNTISFDGEGIFTINDSIYGSYFIDETNVNNVIWVYDRLDTMRFVDYISNYNTIIVENMPIFTGRKTLFKKL